MVPNDLNMDFAWIWELNFHILWSAVGGNFDISCQGSPPPPLFEFMTSCLKELKAFFVVSAKFVFKTLAKIIAKWDQASDLPSSQL